MRCAFHCGRDRGGYAGVGGACFKSVLAKFAAEPQEANLQDCISDYAKALSAKWVPKRMALRSCRNGLQNKRILGLLRDVLGIVCSSMRWGVIVSVLTKMYHQPQAFCTGRSILGN